ncbi:MAG: hypothetical protein FD180_3005 [Planctomycetota bacterium]|nr:MAG: hypothetical protein FD180_3005 [Planctomycetota bacterium]
MAEFERAMNGSGDHEWNTFRTFRGPMYEARRPMPIWTLPSGSTCYVFDERGQFVDWVLDNGENTTWDTNWGQTNRATAIYEQVIREIGERPRK